ncbi:ATP-binding protein [Streptomyces sp. UNOB3_S3]|uniref:ATP-binding protein n=1 Tax=Streptomyces sp. UNOB3_S3 TaxID=2871682 RepID=UPI001E45DEB1|nr:ATP-binding protein [Streptomyces sp. UNOB3_S3]MCC3777987.1 ATP-binding protein [Streptomyces sp. UNOB3_S3]
MLLHAEPFEYRLLIPHDARAVQVARTSIRAALTAHGLRELIGRAELLAGEMLTNTIVHTSSTAELTLAWSQWETLRVAVRDACARTPTLRVAARPFDSDGRGLCLLQTLADRWGYTPLHRDLHGEETKTVWCEISRRVPAAWA